MTFDTEYGVGQYSSDPNESHYAGRSRYYKTGGRGVIWAHSAGSSSSDEPWKPTNSTLPLLNVLTSLGAAVMAGDFGGNSTWGNDTAQARITEAWAYLKSRYGVKTDKVILAGVSMGGLNILNWARANPSLVKAILLFYPVVNLKAQHDGTGGATNSAAGTEAAYGGSAGFTANWASHDPAQHATAYTGVSIYMGHSDVDAVVGSTNQAAWVSAVGGTALTNRVYAGAGHADMTKPNITEIQSWLSPHM